METVSRLIQTVLMNAVWQAPAVLIAAALSARLLRRSAARQVHVVWVAGLLLASVVPLTSLWPGNFGLPEVVVPLAADEPQARASGQPAAGSAGTWAAMLGAAYFGFVLFRVARLGWAYRRTRRIRAGARFAPLSAPLRAAADHCASALGITPVRILRSESIDGPITLGWLDPVIVLPGNLFDETSPDVLRSVVGHELAHIRRRDFALNLLCELVSIPVALHPAVALIKRRVQASRELACDELVADRVLAAPVYARSLVDVAGALSGLRQPAYSLGISDSDILEERVGRLVARRGQSRAAAAPFAAAAVILAASGWAASAHALRDARADLRGTVLDPGGAVVPDAQVLVRNVSTGAHRIALTAPPGGFRFSDLEPGRYRLEVRRPGFRLFRSKLFLLDGKAPLRVSARLSLGVVRESITVHGN